MKWPSKRTREIIGQAFDGLQILYFFVAGFFPSICTPIAMVLAFFVMIPSVALRGNTSEDKKLRILECGRSVVGIGTLVLVVLFMPPDGDQDLLKIPFYLHCAHWGVIMPIYCTYRELKPLCGPCLSRCCVQCY